MRGISIGILRGSSRNEKKQQCVPMTVFGRACVSRPHEGHSSFPWLFIKLQLICNLAVNSRPVLEIQRDSVSKTNLCEYVCVCPSVSTSLSSGIALI